MTLEAMLTRLEVNSHGELFAGFRNLGGVYFPTWGHLFVTGILGRKRDSQKEKAESIKNITDKLKANPKLAPHVAEEKVKIKNKYWLIYQLLCAASLKEEFPEEFIRGHYTQQARWNLCVPGNVIELDSGLVKILEKRKEISRRFEELEMGIGKTRKKSHATRTVHDLDDLFEDYNGQNYTQILIRARQVASLSGLEQEVFDLRKTLADEINNANQIISGARIVYRATKKDSRDRELRIEQDSWDYLRKPNPKIRMPKGEEIWKKKWMSIDIEIPFWRRPDAKITWVGARYELDGKKTSSLIYTTHQPGEREIQIMRERGFEIVVCKDEEDLVSKIACKVREENPDIVSSYNARFDFLKLRESSAGFPIGDEETQPLLKVTTKFFERIGVKDRLVIDPMRWHKIAKAYEINSKLETADNFEKPIDYNELEADEEAIIVGDKNKWLESATYLAGDIEHLSAIRHSREFRRSLDAVCWLSETFGVGIERLLHSANCLNECQEREYFSELGIYREEVPPHQRTKKMQEKRTRAKERLKQHISQELLPSGEVKGLSQDVCKVALPIGDFFRELVLRRFPNAKKLYDCIDRFGKDKQILFFLEQYSKEFARWIREDYGEYIELKDKFQGLLDKSRIEERWLNQAYWQVRTQVLSKSSDDFEKLAKGNLTPRCARHYLPANVSRDLAKRSLTLKSFVEIINSKVRVERKANNVIGNYAVFPDRRHAPVNPPLSSGTPLVIEEQLRARVNRISEFLRVNELDIVAREGQYLYLRGNGEALQKPDCPVILVDDIPKLYHADNPYYCKNGFYSHMKLKDEPDFHLNVFEMRVFREILDNLMQARDSEAFKVYTRAIERLRTDGLDFQEALYHNKTRKTYLVYGSFREDPRLRLEHERKNSSGKIYFVMTAPETAKVGRDEQGREYYIETYLSGEKERTRSIYVNPPQEDIVIDRAAYERRFSKRARDILAPVKPEVERNTRARRRRNQILQKEQQGLLQFN